VDLVESLIQQLRPRLIMVELDRTRLPYIVRGRGLQAAVMEPSDDIYSLEWVPRKQATARFEASALPASTLAAAAPPASRAGGGVSVAALLEASSRQEGREWAEGMEGGTADDREDGDSAASRMLMAPLAVHEARMAAAGLSSGAEFEAAFNEAADLGIPVRM
jgi:hypothetical protein